MPISGSLETFSLPELFQIVESGKKTGRLSFKPGLKNQDQDLKGTFELWFQEGNFVTIINSVKYQSLIAEIQAHGWVDSKTLVRTKYSCPDRLALGSYFSQQNILTPSQIDSLFKLQVDEAIKIFEVEFAWFKFEEVNNINKIASDGETFPWKEMTGRQKKAAELSIEAMRSFSDWQRFAEDMPFADCGLQKLVNSHGIQLSSLEKCLWNLADGSVSLKQIAQKQEFDLERVKQAALSMILAGLIEEVPVTNSPAKAATAPKIISEPVVVGNTNLATKTQTKSKASKSLINNLVSFLRNNF